MSMTNEQVAAVESSLGAVAAAIIGVENALTGSGDEGDNNLVDEVSGGLRAIGCSITPPGTFGGKDATGGHVESLTEAVMGVTAGLVQIAQALHDVADAIREREAAP